MSLGEMNSLMFEKWEEEMEAEKERKNSQKGGKTREVESCRSQQRWEFDKGENGSARCCNEVRGEDPGSKEENVNQSRLTQKMRING